MFWIFVCLTAAGAFGAGMVLAQARLRVPPGAPPTRVAGVLPAPAGGTRTGDVMEELLDLQAGDVVVHMGVDHLVANAMVYTGDGVKLVVAQLEADVDQVILVTSAPRPLAVMARQVEARDLPERPPDVVMVGGLTWRRQRRAELKAPHGPATVVHQFEGPDFHHLWLLEQPGSAAQVFQGRVMQPNNVMVLRAR